MYWFMYHQVLPLRMVFTTVKSVGTPSGNTDKLMSHKMLKFSLFIIVFDRHSTFNDSVFKKCDVC